MNKKATGEKPVEKVWEQEPRKLDPPKWSDYLQLQRLIESIRDKHSGVLAGMTMVFGVLIMWNIYLTSKTWVDPEVWMDRMQSRIDTTLDSYGQAHHDQTNDITSLKDRLDHNVEIQDALFKHLGLEAYQPDKEWLIGKVNPKHPRRFAGMSPTGSDQFENGENINFTFPHFSSVDYYHN